MSYFKRVTLLLIGFQNNSNVAVLLPMAYEYIMLYHTLFCGLILKYFIYIALKLPSSWKLRGVFLLLKYFSEDHLFTLSLKNRLQFLKVQIVHLIMIIYQKFGLDTNTVSFI